MKIPDFRENIINLIICVGLFLIFFMNHNINETKNLDIVERNNIVLKELLKEHNIPSNKVMDATEISEFIETLK